MNLICNLNEFNKNNIFFMETRNNMIMNGHFTKLIYSDENVTLNSIYGTQLNNKCQPNYEPKCVCVSFYISPVRWYGN